MFRESPRGVDGEIPSLSSFFFRMMLTGSDLGTLNPYERSTLRVYTEVRVMGGRMEPQIRLAGSARQFMRELGRPEQRILAEALKSAFGGKNHSLVVRARLAPDGYLGMLLAIGYLIAYRPMTSADLKQYDCDRGVIIMDMMSGSDAQPF
ncbi:hypothetical protein [Streptomyces sp. NPDC047525]|uniref:hypothetical protein n=1 Tax=Streptomyces sp. NPDC047525 TaxID=3155264 RepID=UPI0033CD5EAB